MIAVSIRTARFWASRRTKHPISVRKRIKAVWYTAVGLNQYIPEDISTITYRSRINKIRLACTIPDLEKALPKRDVFTERKKKKMAPQLKNPHSKKTRK